MIVIGVDINCCNNEGIVVFLDFVFGDDERIKFVEFFFFK